MTIDDQRPRGIAAFLKSAPNLALVVVAIAALALIILVAGSPAQYVYDEHFYLEGAWLLKKGASFHQFLLAPLNTPAGPLYATIHWLLSPLTGLQAPAIRWPNLVLFGLGTAACAYALSLWRLENAWMRAAMLFAMPIFWVTAGMALTEIPAFAFASFCLAATAWGMTAPEDAPARLWSGFILGALCLGIAVLGRQPYLPAVGGFVMIALFAPRFRWPAAVAAVVAFAVPLPVFLLWGGLVAPNVARVGGFNLGHGALAFAYMSALVLILAPAYFLDRWKWSLAAGLVVGLIIVLTGGMPATIGQGVAAHLPPLLAHLFQLSIAVVLAGGGASLVVASGANIWTRRDDRMFVLMVLLMLGLTSTTAAIVHIFSSRYLMTAFPFALFAVQPFFRPSRCAVARLALGALGGYLSLANYLHWVPPVN
ncbi:MAG: hypothetical protein JWN66_1720 [Sphingomonas bacterium]|uniref:hypothetical protein n=1 Tax=Sphingomonas bacterium TaxID=1895847 RepID=UPI00263293F0|nr:hypothetical protein [Sphingomonas bacterium]MDB5704604.1 hypothetical protein [Sphingomonas bacterium]